jgi:hypothetical protein
MKSIRLTALAFVFSQRVSKIAGLANTERKAQKPGLCFPLSLLIVLAACNPDLAPVDPQITFSHAEELVVTIGPRPHDSQGNLLARNYILDTLIDFGLEDPHFHVFSDSRVMDGANVVATATGTTYPEYMFLIGAHYDSIPGGVGSADNATGVATMLEIARYFSLNPPVYTLRFVAFDAEEIGLVGSEHYYQDYQSELGNTLLMLCVDMTQTNESFYLSPLIAFALSANQAIANTFSQVKHSMGFSSSFVFNVTVELAEVVSQGPLRSDIRHWRHDPLLLAWPWAVAFDYHTIPGSIHEIDETGLAISTKFILEFLRGLETHPPVELQVTPTVTMPVDEEILQLLLEKGGMKPTH